MEIRQAISSDACNVAEVHVESWKYAYRGLIPDSILDNLSVENRTKFWGQAIESGNPQLLVVEKNSSLVGWVAFGSSRDGDATSQTGEIEAIYIHPSHWRQGFGEGLLSAAKNILIYQNYTCVTLWVLSGNIRATNFYEKQGFQVDSCSPKVSERGGKILEEIRYKCKLG